MAYTLHNEWIDGTIDGAFSTFTSKRQALRMAKEVAKTACPVTQRIIVNDSDEMTVAAFKLPVFKSLDG